MKLAFSSFWAVGLIWVMVAVFIVCRCVDSYRDRKLFARMESWWGMDCAPDRELS